MADLFTDFITFITNNGSIIQTGAFVLTALVTLSLLYQNRKIARQRATVEMLSRGLGDTHESVKRAKFIKLRDEDVSLKDHASGDTVKADLIRECFNRHELMALGIRENILDEDLYHRWFRSTVIKDWKAATDQEYIEWAKAETNTDKVYCELQWLADKWETENNHSDNPPNKLKAKALKVWRWVWCHRDKGLLILILLLLIERLW